MGVEDVVNDRLRSGLLAFVVADELDLDCFESSVLLLCGVPPPPPTSRVRPLLVGGGVTVLPLDFERWDLGGCGEEEAGMGIGACTGVPATDAANGLAYRLSWALVWETQLDTLFWLRMYLSYASGE